MVGLPAKSGVSGDLMLVIPGVMGIAIWSPRLDAIGNRSHCRRRCSACSSDRPCSERGVAFSKQLARRLRIHGHDRLPKAIYTHQHQPAVRPRSTACQAVTALQVSIGRPAQAFSERTVGVSSGAGDSHNVCSWCWRCCTPPPPTMCAPSDSCFSAACTWMQPVRRCGPTAPLTAADDDGVTALMAACRGGHVALTALLLRLGATPTARDALGRSADWYAQVRMAGRGRGVTGHRAAVICWRCCSATRRADRLCVVCCVLCVVCCVLLK